METRSMSRGSNAAAIAVAVLPPPRATLAPTPDLSHKLEVPAPQSVVPSAPVQTGDVNVETRPEQAQALPAAPSPVLLNPGVADKEPAVERPSERARTRNADGAASTEDTRRRRRDRRVSTDPDEMEPNARVPASRDYRSLREEVIRR